MDILALSLYAQSISNTFIFRNFLYLFFYYLSNQSFAVFLYVLQSQYHARYRPSLRRARMMIYTSIQVSQLRQTCPFVQLNILGVWLKKGEQLLFSQIVIKDGFGCYIKPIKPNPLGAIMITEALSCLKMSRIFTIVIIS